MHLIDYLSSFCLVLLLEFCSVLSFGPHFFVSSFWQPPCVYFCILDRDALTLCLSSVAYCRKVHWEVQWGGVLGNCQDRATHVPGWWSLQYGITALWLCVGEGSEKGQCHCLSSGVLICSFTWLFLFLLILAASLCLCMCVR